MMRNTRYRYASIAALALIAATAPAASAVVQDPLPIAPNTYFTGQVNGAGSDAIIKVVCPGPITPGETTHPLDGQSIEVETLLPSASNEGGFTGSAAHSIDALLSTPSGAAANPPVVFTSYFAPATIPTTWVVPCSGTGVITFIPLPTSPTARSYALTVTFADIAD
jgi:hypothetical protein